MSKGHEKLGAAAAGGEAFRSNNSTEDDHVVPSIFDQSRGLWALPRHHRLRATPEAPITVRWVNRRLQFLRTCAHLIQPPIPLPLWPTVSDADWFFFIIGIVTSWDGKRPNLHPKLQPGIPGYDFALELQPEIDGYNSVRQSCSYDFVATTLTKVVAVNLWL